MELTIEMRARSGKFQELYQTLQALLPLIRKEKGCKECRIYRDVDDGEVFFLFMNWDALTHLEHYMQSNNGVALLGAMDLLAEDVRVKIGSESPWEGVDILKQMRKQTN